MMNRRESFGRLSFLGLGCFLGSSWTAKSDQKNAVNMNSNELILKAIPSTGEKIPAVGLGTWQNFDIGPSKEERAGMKEVLKAFVELGGKVIDSSPMYGRSEAVVGDLLDELGLHDQVFLATKVWTEGKEAGIAQMMDSSKKMKAPVIDLMQVHNLKDVTTHLETLRAWKKEGKVRYLGVTHYHESGHEAVEKILQAEVLDFLQINYSITESQSEKRILPLAQDKKVAVLANRPFAGGNVFAKLREKPLPDYAKEIECDSWAQLLIKFVISHPAITCAIPATTKLKHMQDNMKAGYGPLPDEALRRRIAAEAQKVS